MGKYLLGGSHRFCAFNITAPKVITFSLWNRIRELGNDMPGWVHQYAANSQLIYISINISYINVQYDLYYI